MEEFDRTDDHSKDVLESIAKKLTDSVWEMMKGPNGTRTGIDRVLGKKGHKVLHY